MCCCVVVLLRCGVGMMQIIIAPHGAGLSNIMYAAAGTVVIEIAFDKCEVMCIDEMYVPAS